MLRTCVFVLLLVQPFAGFAAQEAAQEVRETVEVTLIEIPVHVVDRNGEPVRGLTAANFEIVDRGRKRPISYFEVVDVGERVKRPEEPPQPIHPAARRNLLLLFDLNHSTPATLERARRSADTFLQDALRPGDRAALTTFTVEEGFRILVNFTDDWELLRKAVAEVGTSRQFRFVDPLVLSLAFEPLAPGEVRDGPNEKFFYDWMSPIFIAGQPGYDDMVRLRIRRQMEQFAQLSRALDAMRGMKQVILLSEGFDAKFLQGRVAGSEQQTEELQSIVEGSSWLVDNDRRFGSVSARAALDQMTALFRRSDVVLNAFDIGGVRVAADLQSRAPVVAADETTFSKASTNDSLFLMADGTGGQVFKNENDMRANFDRLNRQQEVTYILGFQISGSTSTGEFHEVDVRLRNVPGARAYHRAGYWDSAERSALARTFSLAEIVVNDIPQDDLKLDLLAIPFVRGEQADVGVVLEIDGASVLRNSRDGLFVGDLFVYAFDEQNRVAASLFQRLSIDTAKVGEQLAKRGVKFYGTMRLAPGTYTLKTVVHSTTSGGNGYVRSELRVPSKSDGLFAMVVDRPDEWVLVRGTPQSDQPVPYHFEFAGQSFIPAARPVLASSGDYQVVIVSYDGVPPEVPFGAEVLGPQNSTRPAELTLMKASAGSEHEGRMLLFRFVPENVAPGAYTLQLAAGGRVASVPFAVE